LFIKPCFEAHIYALLTKGKTLKFVLNEYCRFVCKLQTATRGDGGEVCCGGAGNGNGGFVDGDGGSTERL
jgi:hypothetical protein